ncbi:MAG: EAL domain-containing protein [Geminicoccaceae bacterium]
MSMRSHSFSAHGIINLANSLGLKTIAEGVETEDQRQFLVASNCDRGQGFLFNPALPESEMLSLLKGIATADHGPIEPALLPVKSTRLHEGDTSAREASAAAREAATG